MMTIDEREAVKVNDDNRWEGGSESQWYHTIEYFRFIPHNVQMINNTTHCANDR